MKQVVNEMREMLQADEAVAAIIAAKVYHGLAPSNVDLPYITFAIEDSDCPKNHDAAGNIAADLYTISLACQSGDADEAFELAEAVDLALNKRSSAHCSVYLKQNISTSAEFRGDQSGDIVHTATITITARRKAE